jgi:hypothetical protein
LFSGHRYLRICGGQIRVREYRVMLGAGHTYIGFREVLIQSENCDCSR